MAAVEEGDVLGVFGCVGVAVFTYTTPKEVVVRLVEYTRQRCDMVCLAQCALQCVRFVTECMHACVCVCVLRLPVHVYEAIALRTRVSQLRMCARRFWSCATSTIMRRICVHMWRRAIRKRPMFCSYIWKRVSSCARAACLMCSLPCQASAKKDMVCGATLRNCLFCNCCWCCSMGAAWRRPLAFRSCAHLAPQCGLWRE